MATRTTRSRVLLAGVTILTLAALCAIGLATFQIADIKEDITRILDSRQADTSADCLNNICTLHDQDKWTSARPVKDWKWIIGYSSPARIKYADVQAIAGKLTTLHRNMLLTFALGAAAAILFALLAHRVVRSIRGILTKLAADLQEVSTLTCPTAGTTRGIDPDPAAPTTILDQALHATWDELPGVANPGRNLAGNVAPPNRTAAEARDVIPQGGNEPEDC